MKIEDTATPTSDTTSATRPDGGAHRPAPAAASATDPALLDDAGRALFSLGRLFGKPQPQHLAESGGRTVELSRILVVQAVEAGPIGPDQELTVGAVAARLDIDPSTASRLVTESIRDGYLSRTASQADARRVRLALTAAGRALAADARRYQRAVFEHVTRDWSDAERREFARLFVRFAAAVADARANPPTPEHPPSP
jgi:DNA-binding MarR family transcriptional regulator